MPKSVYITYSEGCCWRRVLDARLAQDYFARNGYEISASPETAAIIFLVTCAFIRKTEESALRKTEELKRCPGELIVSGCLPGISPDKLGRVFRGKICPVSDMRSIDALFPGSPVKFSRISDANRLLRVKSPNRSLLALWNICLYFFPNILSARFHGNFYKSLIKAYQTNKAITGKIFYMRISWGCGGLPLQPHCSYCVEWKAVGNFRSKDRKECLNEFRQGLQAGYRKYALLADNTSAYGEDTGDTLVSLLKEMLQNSPKEAVFIIDSLHPVFLIRYLNDWIEIFKTGRIKWVMLAVQSGDDSVLKAMKRQYDSKQLKNAVSKIHAACPGLQISTQVIVGFPGETDEAFKNTLGLLKECRFFNAVIFPYCRLSGTEAAELDSQVPVDIILSRVKIMKKFLQKNGIFHFHLKLGI